MGLVQFAAAKALASSAVLLFITLLLMASAKRFFIVYGRVPMFYYIVHIYLIHAVTVIAGAAQGYGFAPFFNLWFGFPQGYGYGLAVAYLVWFAVVLALYPACQWYGALKRRRRDVWLSYL